MGGWWSDKTRLIQIKVVDEHRPLLFKNIQFGSKSLLVWMGGVGGG